MIRRLECSVVLFFEKTFDNLAEDMKHNSTIGQLSTILSLLMDLMPSQTVFDSVKKSKTIGSLSICLLIEGLQRQPYVN